MKLSVLFSFIILVSAFFFGYALITSDINDGYDTNINSSEWDNKYDFVEDLNDSISPLEQKFKVIQDEDEGFFTRALASGIVVYYVVILFPQVVFSSLTIGGEISTSFLTALLIPSYLIIIATLLLLTWALFKLLEFFQGNKI